MQPIYELFPKQEDLEKLGEERAGQYSNANPFPHISIDNIFNPEILDRVLAEMKTTMAAKWDSFDDTNQVKRGLTKDSEFGPETRTFLHFLNSKPFLSFLEKISGIDALIPDPDFSGGGLHEIKPGGFLKIHADFNKHPRTKLDRRLNVLIFLNKDWKEEYGGHFEVWNREMTKAENKILPVFNRLAMFSTTSHSWHGHPDPLKCPEGMSRKSIALYYYTNGRPQHEIEEGMEKHSTLFQDRAVDQEQKKEYKQQKSLDKRKVKALARQVTPPFLWDAAKKLKK